MDSNPQQNAKTSTSLKQQSLTTTGNQPESPPMKSSEDTSTSMSATTPDASEPVRRATFSMGAGYWRWSGTGNERTRRGGKDARQGGRAPVPAAPGDPRE